MEIKTAKQCKDEAALDHKSLRTGHLYRKVDATERSEHGLYYIACSVSGNAFATGAVSLKTGYRLDGAFSGTRWAEVMGHVCIEE